LILIKKFGRRTSSGNIVPHSRGIIDHLEHTCLTVVSTKVHVVHDLYAREAVWLRFTLGREVSEEL
jgi:hypothetical protein